MALKTAVPRTMGIFTTTVPSDGEERTGNERGRKGGHTRGNGASANLEGTTDERGHHQRGDELGCKVEAGDGGGELDDGSRYQAKDGCLAKSGV